MAAAGNYNWAITAAFYAALHDVNALMVRAGKYTDDMDHPVREIFLSDHHPAIATRYAAMLGKSIRARYVVGWTADEESYTFQVKHLDAVRDYVTRVVEGLVKGV